MTDLVKPQRAIVSVSDKTGLVEFARALGGMGVELYSSGGTAKALGEAGVQTREVSEYTGFPEMLDGRVKTLHPKVHGGILARRDRAEDRAALESHAIVSFDLVVVNLYPFEATVAKAGTTWAEAVEQIDIGGPSLLRAAAKNHAWVAVVCDPAQYSEVLDELRQCGGTTFDLRKKLAEAAFRQTACYDGAITSYFTAGRPTAEFPPTLSPPLRLRETLRYGENPHQAGAVYVESGAAGGVAGAEQLSGKELSYNNLLDLDAAWGLAREFADPVAVIIKHTNPCGVACAAGQEEAFRKAWESDPVSAFGSVLGFNQTLDRATAEAICEPNRFVEAIVAPEFDPAAVEVLTTRPTWKKSVRLLRIGAEHGRGTGEREYRRISGGMLVQACDAGDDPQDDWKSVTRRACTPEERRGLEFAWKVSRQVKSNAIVFVRDTWVVGVGAGQMSRVDSVWLAARKAGERSRGAVLASDAFFPFRDGVDQAAGAGITAVIQPGGSRRDDEVIAACNEHNMAMIFTGRRHFRH